MDIRLPIGLLFSAIGILLTIFGLSSDPWIYQPSLGININLWWGLVILIFGAAFLLASRRRTASKPSGENN
jgi:hypothetical protein